MKRYIISFLLCLCAFEASSQLLTDCKHPCEKTRIVPYGAFIGVQISDILFSKHVLVTQVIAGTAAQAIGIRPGDTLFHLDGMELENTAHLLREVSSRQPGDLISLQVRRNGETKEFVFPLGAQFSRTVKEWVCCDEDSEATGPELLLSLNAAEDRLIVQSAEAVQGTVQAEVLNESGKVCRSARDVVQGGTLRMELPVGDLPMGAYILNIKIGEQRYAKRFRKGVKD